MSSQKKITKHARRAVKGHLVSNDALRAMPGSEFRILYPQLRYQEMPDHLVLHQPNKPVKFLYFPNSGLISIVVLLLNGRTVEAGIVGREGIIGLPGLMGFPRHPLQEVVQIAGSAFRIPLQAFRTLLPRLPELRKRADRYSMSLGLQVAQTAACNRVHGLEQRLARWLLMGRDRVQADSLAITQDFLATMMGTDRPSVTLAEGVLTRAGAIVNTRGVVRIVNRSILESIACECYDVISIYSAAVATGRLRFPRAKARAKDIALASAAAAGSTLAPNAE